MNVLVVYYVKYDFDRDKTIYNYDCTNAPSFLWKDCDGIVRIDECFRDARIFLSFAGNFPEKHWWHPDFKVFGINIIPKKGYLIPIISSPLFQRILINGAYLKVIGVRAVWKRFRHIRVLDDLIRFIFHECFFKTLEKNRPKFIDVLRGVFSHQYSPVNDK